MGLPLFQLRHGDAPVAASGRRVWEVLLELFEGILGRGPRRGATGRGCCVRLRAEPERGAHGYGAGVAGAVELVACRPNGAAVARVQRDPRGLEFCALPFVPRGLLECAPGRPGPAADCTRPRPPGTGRGAGTLRCRFRPASGDVRVRLRHGCSRGDRALSRSRLLDRRAPARSHAPCRRASGRRSGGVPLPGAKQRGGLPARGRARAGPCSRLAACATLHAGVDFRQGGCAVCARCGCRSRLREAVFPARGAAAAPAWLLNTATDGSACERPVKSCNGPFVLC